MISANTTCTACLDEPGAACLACAPEPTVYQFERGSARSVRSETNAATGDADAIAIALMLADTWGEVTVTLKSGHVVTVRK